MSLKHLNRDAPGPKLNADQAALAVPGGLGGGGEPETRAGGWAGGLHVAEGPGAPELPCRPSARVRMAEGAGEGEVRRAHQHTQVHKCTHTQNTCTQRCTGTQKHTGVRTLTQTHRCTDPGTHTPSDSVPSRVWLHPWKDGSKGRGFAWCWGSPCPRVWSNCGQRTSETAHVDVTTAITPAACCTVRAPGVRPTETPRPMSPAPQLSSSHV